MKRIVRKILCLLIYVLCFQSVIKAQTLNDVAHSKEITWYGIDFSCARFQNFDDKFKTEFLKDSLLNFWSMNPLYSGDKNFIRLRYDKDQIGINVRNSRKRNREINYDNLFTNLTNEIDADTVREIVSEYDLKGTGFGVLIIIEALEKRNHHVYAWVAFIDETNRKVISTRRYISEYEGGGMKLQWMSSIKKIITESGKTLKGYK